ncbi:MAG: ArnT family glycosyltransferase [Candidatus Hodarchaeales archaeon]
MFEREQTTDFMKYHFYFILIIIFAVLFRLFYYMGPSGGDDMIYFSIVKKLLMHAEDAGTVIGSSKHWGARLGMVFPTWAFMKIFGVSQFSSYLFPMISSIGILVFIYIVGTTLFNPQMALLSSFVFALLPQDVWLSGVIYPDLPVALFGALFIYLFYKLSLNENVAIKQSLMVGLILGLGYYIRETSVILLITIPILFFRAPEKRNFCVSVMTGDPLTRVKILMGVTKKLLDPVEVGSYKSKYSSYLLDPFIVVFAIHWISSLMILIVIGTLILFIIQRNNYQVFSLKKGHVLWLFILTFGILAYYCYGPVFGLDKPLKRSPRYYHTITPFASLLLGVILYEFISRKGIRKFIGCSLILFYILASLFSLGSIVNKHSHGINLIDEFIIENPAENYMIPQTLELILQLKHGLTFLEERIIPYKYNEVMIHELRTNVRKDDTIQYVFYAPKIHKRQSIFREYIKWPMKKVIPVTVMSTPPRISCRILKSNAFLFNVTPEFFKSTICYTTEVYVYQLK